MAQEKDSEGLVGEVIRIEEIRESIYRQLAEIAKDPAIKDLLESLVESKRRHVALLKSMLERAAEEQNPILKVSPSLGALAKKASWIKGNLERKKEIAPTIQSKMLMIEFLQRTEEESYELHRSLKGSANPDYGSEIQGLVLEEKREVENLRQLAVRTLSFF